MMTAPTRLVPEVATAADSSSEVLASPAPTVAAAEEVGAEVGSPWIELRPSRRSREGPSRPASGAQPCPRQRGPSSRPLGSEERGKDRCRGGVSQDDVLKPVADWPDGAARLGRGLDDA